jgi:hypothetical protein
LSNPPNFPTGIPIRRKPRFGILTSIVLFLVAGCAFLLVFTAIYAPWAYYLGGHFHVIPYWQGWGRTTVKSAGGDFLLFVRMEPTTRGSRVYPMSNLKGVAYLCTPAGERFRLRLGGSMPFRLNRITTGEPIHLYMSNSLTWNRNFTVDHRPGLDFYGTWADRRIELDDRRTLSTSFLPDGTVYRKHDPNHPMGKETADLTLKEGTYKEFEAACSVKAK